MKKRQKKVGVGPERKRGCRKHSTPHIGVWSLKDKEKSRRTNTAEGFRLINTRLGWSVADIALRAAPVRVAHVAGLTV